jgi:hypothetical protein
MDPQAWQIGTVWGRERGPAVTAVEGQRQGPGLAGFLLANVQTGVGPFLAI